MNEITFAIIALSMWNTVVFFMYGLDKRKAKRNKRRISEKTLLVSAAVMGGLGALLGMHVFHHKTNHMKFKIGVPMLLLLNVLIVVAIVILPHLFQRG